MRAPGKDFKVVKLSVPYDNYLLDNYGNVYNRYGHRLAKDLNIKGYLKVALYYKGRRKWELLHRLVAFHFCAEPWQKPNFDGYDVHHHDRNRQNNYWRNLRVWPKVYHMVEHLNERI